MKLLLAIIWSFILVRHIIACATGVPPSWVDVFIPLVAIFCDCWLNWGLKRLHEYKNKNKYNAPYW